MDAESPLLGLDPFLRRHIFEYLDFKGLCIVSRVSKRFHSETENDCIWKALFFVKWPELERAKTPIRPGPEDSWKKLFAQRFVAHQRKKKSIQDFDLGKKIGEGSYGEVRLGTDKDTGREFAVKILNKAYIMKEKKAKWVQREKKALDMLRHVNIIELVFSFQDQENLYFVLELCPNGDLEKLLKQHIAFDEDVARFYLAEVLVAVEYMQSKGIVYRDLKPENMLLAPDRHVRLIDFGTAINIGNNPRARALSFVGTAEYVSPELLGEEDPHTLFASDIWAYGCVVYQFLCGCVPFKGITDLQVFEAIKGQKVVYPVTGGPSADARDLIDKLLVEEPMDRLGCGVFGIEEIRDHPFFKGIDWAKLSSTPPPEIKSAAVLPMFAGASEAGKKKKSKRKSKVVAVAATAAAAAEAEAEAEADADKGSNGTAVVASKGKKSSSPSGKGKSHRVSKSASHPSIDLPDGGAAHWKKHLQDGETATRHAVFVRTARKKKGKTPLGNNESNGSVNTKEGAKERSKKVAVILVISSQSRVLLIDPAKKQPLVSLKGDAAKLCVVKTSSKSDRTFVFRSAPGQRKHSLRGSSKEVQAWVDAINKLKA
eukprot:TRINITY_DN4431_c5_g1_i1.p1 TRINITY_DN4431_c5_g1~~TRINITY_DN4431_c5_g1_i1.p1  ORF type:complete len:612 (-),score=172.59 TRINITY_DN4431_c5_g1_i1:48-1841(-)